MNANGGLKRLEGGADFLCYENAVVFYEYQPFKSHYFGNSLGAGVRLSAGTATYSRVDSSGEAERDSVARRQSRLARFEVLRHR